MPVDRRTSAVEAWAAEAATLDWVRPWELLCDDQPGPDGRWFVGGEIDVSANCLDRHLDVNGERVAFYWEGEPGDRRAITYRELTTEVAAFAGGLRNLGVGRGDRVAIYLGLVPEAVVAMLACARLGAVHSVQYSALPPDALADRLEDLDPRVVITQDGSWRRGVVLPLKSRADEAMAATGGVEHTIVVRRTGIDIAWYEGDRWYDDVVEDGRDRPADGSPVPADGPLLVTHLGYRRGRPTGIVHRSGGFLTYASTLHRRALTSSPDDVFWCAVDIGWVAGQSHGVYGPLAAGATSLLFEGTLGTPTHGRAWELIERYGVNALVTSPSIARSLRQWVDSPPSEARLDSLRSIVHLGEPIDDATRAWLFEDVGGGRAVIRDGWGQTELGAIVTVDPSPDHALPDPGLEVLDEHGRPAAVGAAGELTLGCPWPAMLLGIRHEDPGVFERYWRWPGYYATGDLATRDADGRVTILGRMDPMVNVSGQLVSANEVRDVLEEHPLVVAAEVVARSDRRTGQSVVACVVLDAGAAGSDGLAYSPEKVSRELTGHVQDSLGGLARPRGVLLLDEMPTDIPRDDLRRALSVISSARPTDVLRVSADQVRAAVEASGGGS
jgi:acetyl-CoA synthetase